jgi:hypothetical protein
LVVNSCARGKAVPESDLDLAVLVKEGVTPEQIRQLDEFWNVFKHNQPIIIQYMQSGYSTKLHLDIFDGYFSPQIWDDGGGPDLFELEIGNRIAHAKPLYKKGDRFEQLCKQWLPYYDDELRSRRLHMVKQACLYDLNHVAIYHNRGLHFQAFDRLYKAFQEFMQALFISKRIYPVAYNKWIKEQVQDWLSLPEIYKQLPAIISVPDIESNVVCEKAIKLKELLEACLNNQVNMDN